MACDPHAKQRATERYGYELTASDQRRLCAKLAFQTLEPTEDCYLVRIQPDKRERWIVWFKGEWMAVVYNPATGSIVTFLPLAVVRDNKHKLPW